MNWTSRQPIPDAKCIVETNNGCTFAARFSGGAWWSTERGTLIQGVRRWIIYPEGEEPNDYIPAECLLKYVMKEYRTATSKLEAVRKLNQQLVKEFWKASPKNNKTSVENEQLRAELKLCRKRLRRMQTLFKALSKITNEADLMKVETDTDEQTIEVA